MGTALGNDGGQSVGSQARLGRQVGGVRKLGRERCRHARDCLTLWMDTEAYNGILKAFELPKKSDEERRPPDLPQLRLQPSMPPLCR